MQEPYTLVQSFEVPFSGYVSSVQECEDTILVDSGMQGLIGEYKEDGTLVKQFQMNLSKYYITGYINMIFPDICLQKNDK